MTFAISQTTINLAYLVASVCLIIGIKRLSSPATARSGNVVAAVGMAIAILFTFRSPDIDTYWIILAGMAVGTVIGVASARMVKMTAIPQMVALFNGVGGGAAVGTVVKKERGTPIVVRANADNRPSPHRHRSPRMLTTRTTTICWMRLDTMTVSAKTTSAKATRGRGMIPS